MMARLFVLIGCLVGTSTYLGLASASEPVLVRRPLGTLPMQIGAWSGQAAPPIDPEIIRVLGVDDHVNRFYVDGDRLAHLYVGYYNSQREGDTIHSPMNCLPGAGWLPVSTGRIDIAAGTGNTPIHVNRYVIQKGLDRQVVLYWYQSQGRVVASDYWSKVYLVLDSIRRNRTDAALVRVIAPYDAAGGSPEDDAERAAVAFVKAIFPVLNAYLPS
jgi:EpsI family protein